MKISVIISLLFLVFSVSFNHANAQMMGKKCNLPAIPHTSDSGSSSVMIIVEYIQNGAVLKTYSNTFTKGQGATFFTDPNLFSVYNSGSNLHVVYKSVNAASGSYYFEKCDGADSIPISNTVKTYSAGSTVFGTTVYTLNFKITLKSL